MSISCMGKVTVKQMTKLKVTSCSLLVYIVWLYSYDQNTYEIFFFSVDFLISLNIRLS